jgi:hypothetical protein
VRPSTPTAIIEPHSEGEQDVVHASDATKACVGVTDHTQQVADDNTGVCEEEISTKPMNTEDEQPTPTQPMTLPRTPRTRSRTCSQRSPTTDSYHAALTQYAASKHGPKSVTDITSAENVHKTHIENVDDPCQAALNRYVAAQRQQRLSAELRSISTQLNISGATAGQPSAPHMPCSKMADVPRTAATVSHPSASQAPIADTTTTKQVCLQKLSGTAVNSKPCTGKVEAMRCGHEAYAARKQLVHRMLQLLHATDITSSLYLL